MTPRPRHPIHILLACMPKSGSTFLAQILINMPGMRRERLVPDFERREQELCPQRLREAQALTEGLHRVWRERGEPRALAPRGFAAQHHVRHSRPTARFIGEFGLLPVVLTRNIFDVVPSVYDHIRAEAPPLPMAYFAQDFDRLEEETALAAIADLVIPWYFNFYVSWAKADIDPVRITYEDLTADPEATVARIYTHFGRNAQRSAIETALSRATAGETRRNQAIPGRGEALPSAVRARIAGFARYYPSVDFSPIGLP